MRDLSVETSELADPIIEGYECAKAAQRRTDKCGLNAQLTSAKLTQKYSVVGLKNEIYDYHPKVSNGFLHLGASCTANEIKRQ